MDRMVRIRLDPAERRDQLVELGVKMLSATGLDQISIEDIAKKAGISRGLLFHYFASKREFELAIVKRSSDHIIEHLMPNTDLEPLEMLRDVMDRYVGYVVENKGGYVSMLRGRSSGDPAMRAIVDKNRDVLVSMLLDHVPFPPENITPRMLLAARAWIAFVEESTISWLNQPTIARDELVDLNVTSLFALAVPPLQVSEEAVRSI
jgi:AcrR family transcriptional regulator